MFPLGLIAPPTLAESPFAQATWLTVPRKATAMERASWIWVQTPGTPKPTPSGAPAGTVRFARAWNLSQAPTNAKVHFRADNVAKVRVNGQLVGTSDEWEKLATVEVRLKAGENRIEVEATNSQGTQNQVNPAGLIFAAEATLPSGESVALTSDGTWISPDGTVTVLGDYATGPWNLRPAPVPAPAFRRDFTLNGKVAKATAKVIGLGQFDLYANGDRQGKGVLNGPWSQYDRTLYWQEFDITRSLQVGKNALGVELGNSFYRVEAPPAGRHTKGDAMPDYSGNNPYLLAAVVDITYADGRKERITTDREWRYGPSPYTLSHVFAGEDYDARLFNPAWSRPFYTNRDWQAPLVAETPKAELLPMDWPEFRPIRRWRPTKILESRPGVWTYVFPQNAMATLNFRVKGPRGATVKFKPSEVMTPQGEVQQLNLWGAEASSSYTLKGGASEGREWRFFFHGFQYVEVTGAVPSGRPNPNRLPVLEGLEMVQVRTANPETGEFRSSNELFNQTHDLVDWAVQSNMAYYLSDCPHREKLGWLECAHLLFSTVAYRYDAEAWFRKIGRDMRDIQLPDGRVTTVAPDYLVLPPSSPYKFTIEWGAASVLLPWQAYQWYGDRRFLTDNYAMMRGFVDWIDKNAKDGLAPAGLGDWYDYGHGHGPGPSRFTPTQLTGTAMWAMCADALARSADALSRPEDAARYRAMYGRVRASFLARYYDKNKKTFENNGSVQSGHAMALCAGLVPEADRHAVLEAIIADLKARDYQQTPGDVGHLFFIRALAEAGRSNVLYKVYSRTGVGSYGGILAKGLTTMPETWDAITVGSNSLNHAMLGHVQEWFYGWVLGIRQAPGSVGWKSVVIAPEPGGGHLGRGKIKTPQGEIIVRWRQENGGFRLVAGIPKGSRAKVVFPIPAKTLIVDGKSVTTKPGPFGRPSVEVGPGMHIVELAGRQGKTSKP